MKISRRFVSMLLALTMVFSLVPATLLGAAAVEPIEYLKYNEKGEKEAATCSMYAPIDETYTPAAWSNGTWYVVQGDAEISGTVTVNGSVNLILANGCNLTVTQGIRVNTGNSLTIYAQSENPDTMGTLVVNNSSANAATIGGDDKTECGTVTIHGGHVQANGHGYAAAIGGGTDGDGGTVTVYNGIVEAIGAHNTPGIGAGCNRTVGKVVINGGTVTATGSGQNGINASDVIINGGTVNATGDAVAIGTDGGSVGLKKGVINFAHGPNGVNFAGKVRVIDNADIIDNATNNLIVKTEEQRWGDVLSTVASITVLNCSAVPYLYYVDGNTFAQNGEVDDYTVLQNDITELLDGWYVLDHDVTVDVLTVSGNVRLILEDGFTLTANEGVCVEDPNSLTVYAQSEDPDEMGKLIAYGAGEEGESTPAIGTHSKVSCGTITIYGGDILADASDCSASGIGCAYHGNGSNAPQTTSGTLTVYGGKVTALGGTYSAGIGGSLGGKAGSVMINGGEVTATGGFGAAGIGGGWNGMGGTVTINGGLVTATGDEYRGAGIGGASRSGGTVTINGGEVHATANGDGAGIGGGFSYTCDTITINGGEIYAYSESGSAIGAGSRDTTGTLYYTNHETGTSANIVPDGTVWGDVTVNGGRVTVSHGEDGKNFEADVSFPDDTVPADAITNTAFFKNTEGFWMDRLNADDVSAFILRQIRGDIPYLYYEDGDAVPTSGTCHDGDYTFLRDAGDTLGDGWYVADVSTGLLEVTGDAHLILLNYSTVNIRGIHAAPSASITIYAQSEEQGTMGVLVADSRDTQHPGIGGGDVTIHGGTVTAYGGDFSAGIGNAFNSTNDCTVTINGGTVNANGGGAGLSGDDGGDGIGGIVTINDGDVTALAGDGGCGLGGTVTVMGGQVEAAGKYTGAGIGGGDVTIHGGKVTAFGGSQGAGINCGGTLSIKNNVSVGATGCGDCDGIYAKEIFIHGGTVTAYGGSQGAGIYCDGTLSITNNVTIEATGCGDADGIYATEMRMYSGTLTAQGGTNGNGINIKWNATLGGSSVTATGHGIGAGVRSYNSVEVICGTFTATGGENGPGIICADLSLDANEAKVTGGTGCAGIQSEKTTISGGTVTAQGGEGGAGIGGENKTITIYRDSVVTATGGKNAVGIGGTGTKVSISGNSDVTAVGGEGGAGIGCSELRFTGGYITAKGGSGADAIRVQNDSITIAGTGMTLTRGEGGQNVVATSINLLNNTYLKDSVTGNVISKQYGQSLLARLNESDVTAFTVVNAANTSYLYYESGSTEAQPGTVPAGFNMVNTSMTVLSGWNIVYDNLTLETLTVTGDAHLILMDGVTLTVNDRIIVDDGAGLSVYAQTQDPDVMGSLVVNNDKSDSGSAAIGGSNGNACGTVTIHGGHVQANCKAYGAAVIGGGYGAGGGTITVYDGIVEAIGANKTHGMGAGYGMYESTGTVTVNGGTVTVAGNNLNGINAANVTINGGSVIAEAVKGRAIAGTVTLAKNVRIYDITDGEPGDLIPADGTATIPDSAIKVFVTDGQDGVSLTLSSDIRINFYLPLTDEAAENGEMVFTVNGRTEKGDPQKNENGWFFSCSVNVLEMAETVTASFTLDGKDCVTTCSVADYIDMILEGDYPNEAKTLARKIANYGHYAQTYLAGIHNSVIIGEDGYAEMLKNKDSDIDLDAAKAALGDTFKALAKQNGIKLYARTVYFDSATALNVYVEVDGGEAPEASCEGKAVTVKRYTGKAIGKDNLYVVTVPDIAATELGDQFTVTIGGVDFVMSVLDYCGAVMGTHKDGNEQKDTDACHAMAAFYEYYLAAKQYEASLKD